MRFTLDSNILVYSLDSGTPEKQAIARDIVIRAMDADAILTAQALAEFLNVIRRKFPAQWDIACAQAERWATLFPVAGTAWEHVSRAATFAAGHRLQLWDCVIWQAARAMNAAVFLSEDMQDGLSLEGMTVLNPFNPANRARVHELLTPL